MVNHPNRNRHIAALRVVVERTEAIINNLALLGVGQPFAEPTLIALRRIRDDAQKAIDDRT